PDGGARGLGLPGAAASRQSVLDVARRGEARRSRRSLAAALLCRARSTVPARRQHRAGVERDLIMASALTLAGKHALVTGGGTGIGAAIALALAEAGAGGAIFGRRVPGTG